MTPRRPTGGTRLAVTALARTAGEVRITLAVEGLPDLTVLVARRDGRPAWGETRHLAVRHAGERLLPEQEAVLRLVAASLRDATFEDLARRVPLGPDPASSGPDGAPSGPGDDGSYEIVTVDEWGNPDRWRTFVFRREFKRNASSAIRLGGGNVVTVSHGEAECQYATPSIDGRTMSLYCYPWIRPLEHRAGPPAAARDGTQRLPTYVSTDLRDADVITGGTARLESVLAALAPRTAPGDLVLVKSTCVPRVIGDDMEGAIARWRGRGRIRYDDVFVPEATDFVAEVLAETIAAGKGRRRRGPLVNVAGLAAGETLRELRGLLDEAGITVHAAMIPDIELETAARWREAPLQVLVPNPYYRNLYEKVLRPLPLRTIDPPAPYGLAATAAWLAAIARACGRSTAMRKAWRAARARHSSALDRLRAECSGLRLGFVVGPGDYATLCDPAESAGIPVLDIALELGFGIDLLVFEARGTRADLELRPEHARAVALHRFHDPASLTRLLRDAPCAAVYSDLYGDERITAAGKAPFSLQLFEPGLGGALRTAERLLGACRLPFYRKYGRHDRTT